MTLIIKCPFQLVVAEVANKFAQSHFQRGVRDQNVRNLTKIVIQYLQVMRTLFYFPDHWTNDKPTPKTRPRTRSVKFKMGEF